MSTILYVLRIKVERLLVVGSLGINYSIFELAGQVLLELYHKLAQESAKEACFFCFLDNLQKSGGATSESVEECYNTKGSMWFKALQVKCSALTLHFFSIFTASEQLIPSEPQSLPCKEN